MLRGPQGTGLARNASAGAIKLYSRKPTGQFNGFLRGEVGNYDARDYEGADRGADLRGHALGPLRVPVQRARRHDEEPLRQRSAAARTRPRSARLAADSLTHAPDTDERSVVDLRRARRQRSRTRPTSRTFRPACPTGVNDRNNWAARGTLLFEPTLDMSFLLGGHGARRDELSRLGQSIRHHRRLLPERRPRQLRPELSGRLDAIVNALGGRQDLQGGGYQRARDRAAPHRSSRPATRWLRLRLAQPGIGGLRAATARTRGLRASDAARSRTSSRGISTTSPGRATSTTPADHTTTPGACTCKGESCCRGTSTLTTVRATTLRPRDRHRSRLLAGDALPHLHRGRRLAVLPGPQARWRARARRGQLRCAGTSAAGCCPSSST